MTEREQRLSRRKFLAKATAAITLAGASGAAGAEGPGAGFRSRPPKPSVAGRKPLAVLTTVFRPMSHSFHIAGRFMHGYTANGSFHVPSVYVRGMSVDQTPENDLSRDIAREFGFRWSRVAADAMLDGDKRAVDGGLLSAEHGN